MVGGRGTTGGGQVGDLAIGEAPVWRHAVAFVLQMGEGAAAPWCVRWRPPGERRWRTLERYDSRYAAEQGLTRYRAIAAESGTDGLQEAGATRHRIAGRLRRGTP